jgi:signal transduction histidine kinase
MELSWPRTALRALPWPRLEWPRLGSGLAWAEKTGAGVLRDGLSFLVFNALFWLGYFVVLTLFRSMFLGAIETDALPWRALTIVLVFFITAGAHALIQMSGVHALRLFLVALAASPFTGAAHVLANTLSFNVLAGFAIRGSFSDHFLDLYSGMLWAHVGWAGAYCTWASASELHQQRKRAAAAEAQAREALLQMLQYQLNPHFLFNSLNAISALVLDGRTVDAETMLSRLSGFLRYALDRDPTVKVRLAEELAAQSQYLGVEQARFPDKLRVDVQTGPGLEDALAPSLILQPLVENAIKYAVAPSRAPTAVRVAAREENGMLVLSIEDDGVRGPDVARPRAGAGVGLRNTRRRLDVLYGSEGRVEAGVTPEGGFLVRLRFPLEFAP